MTKLIRIVAGIELLIGVITSSIFAVTFVPNSAIQNVVIWIGFFGSIIISLCLFGIARIIDLNAIQYGKIVDIMEVLEENEKRRFTQNERMIKALKEIEKKEFNLPPSENQYNTRAYQDQPYNYSPSQQYQNTPPVAPDSMQPRPDTTPVVTQPHTRRRVQRNDNLHNER